MAAARFDTRILKYRPHLVITDLTVCDLRGVSSSLDAYRLQAGWETLLRKLLSVPPSLSDTAGAADQGSPAILHLESWDRFSPMGGCRNTSGRIHHEVSVFYHVPARPHGQNIKTALACGGPPACTGRPSGPERGAPTPRGCRGAATRDVAVPAQSRRSHRLCLSMQVVSFMLGVCAHDPATAPARHWPAGCSDGATRDC